MALGAIALWGTLAWIGVHLTAMPPFLLVGCALCGAGVLAVPTWRQWRVAPIVLALGIYGLFGFHFFLFLALRLAPPLEANLVNYLWPLLIVLGAPLVLPDTSLTWKHGAGAFAGFAGAAIVILGAAPAGDESARAMRASNPYLGYACAALSAFIWASYSLWGRRLRETGTSFSSSAVGLFCLASGLLALVCHALFENQYRFDGTELLPLAALAIGPMGLAFFMWDRALAMGDARTIGSLAYLTPLLSTLLLAVAGYGHLGVSTLIALFLIIGGAWLGARTSTPR
jgi:drug/metabolite transporter (DMT)-like permease